MSGKYKIPFNKNGNMVDYPIRWNENCEWKDNYIWDDILEYSSYGRGRSSISFKFKSKMNGKEYYMFVSDFDNIICELNKGMIKGNFTFVKKGKNYGIKKVD